MAEGDDAPIRFNSMGTTLPAGATAPAATDDDTAPVRTPILSTSMKKLPTATGPGQSWDDWLSAQGRGLGLGTRDVVTGLATPLTAALDLGTWLPRVGVRAAGGSATAPSDMLQNLLTGIGLPRTEQDPKLRTPRDRAEAARSLVNEASASMITPMGIGTKLPQVVDAAPALVRPFVGTAPVSSGPLAAGQVAAGGAGAAAGEAAASSDYVPDWLKPSVRLAGNVVGAGVTGKISDAVGKLWNMSQGAQTDMAAALERLRIFPRSAGAVTENPNTRVLEAGVTKAPFSAGVMQPAQRDTSGQFHAAVEDTARLLGPEATKAEAGGSVQRILQDWHANTFPKEQAAVWNPLNEKLAGAAVDPTAYRTALTEMANPPALAGMPATQKAFGSGTAQGWLDALTADLPMGKTMTWEQAHAIKSQIGKAMGTPEIIDSLGMDRLRSLYGGISEGMKGTAEGAGLAKEFGVANQSTIDAHNFIDTTLAKAITARNPGQEKTSPDAAATALLNSNDAMQQLRDRVPQAADALAAYQLRRAVLATAGQQGATDVPSAGSFLTRMRGQQIDRPEGTAALYGDPTVAQNLRDLLRAAGNVKETERLMNTSNTSGALQTGQAVTAPVRWAIAHHYGGLPALAAAVATDAAPYVTAKALTTPLGIRMASTPPGPRPPMDPKVAGLLGYLSGQ
jgi:hypothetical protein